MAPWFVDNYFHSLCWIRLCSKLDYSKFWFSILTIHPRKWIDASSYFPYKKIKVWVFRLLDSHTCLSFVGSETHNIICAWNASKEWVRLRGFSAPPLQSPFHNGIKFHRSVVSASQSVSQSYYYYHSLNWIDFMLAESDLWVRTQQHGEEAAFSTALLLTFTPLPGHDFEIIIEIPTFLSLSPSTGSDEDRLRTSQRTYGPQDSLTTRPGRFVRSVVGAVVVVARNKVPLTVLLTYMYLKVRAPIRLPASKVAHQPVVETYHYWWEGIHLDLKTRINCKYL